MLHKVFFITMIFALAVLTLMVFGDDAEKYAYLTFGREKTLLVQKDSQEDTAEGLRETAWSKLAELLYYKPILLEVPSLGVNLLVEEVGLSGDGVLETPGWQNAGWYTKSARPGQKGNVIIDGHYDTNTGAPAAFWSLKSLTVGDTVALINEVGSSFTYRVTRSFYVDIQDPNRIEVVSPGEEPELTMITCGGVWVPGQATYNKRLVVKGVLVD